MITTYRTDPKLYSPWTKTHHPRKLGLPQEKTTGSLCSLLQSTITKHNQWKTSKAPRPTLQPGISLTTPGASRVSPRASRFSPEPSRIFLFSSFSFFFDLLKRSRDGHSELWGVVTFHPSSGPSCSSCLVLDPPKVLPVSCFQFCGQKMGSLTPTTYQSVILRILTHGFIPVKLKETLLCSSLNVYNLLWAPEVSCW